jgi:hypothetical protein
MKKVDFKTKVISVRDDYVNQAATLVNSTTGYSFVKAVGKASIFFEEVVFEFIRRELNTDDDLITNKKYYISKSYLTNKLGTFQVSGNRYCVLKTINKVAPLFFDVAIGSKITNKITLAQVTGSFQKILNEATTNSEIVTSAMFGGFLDELSDLLKHDKIYIDANSLRKAVVGYDKVHDIKVANRLLHFNNVFGYLPHIINESPFGRKYYKGINLQGASKRIRKDAFPHAIEIDINSASNEWLMQQAKLHGLNYSLIEEFSQNKKAVRIAISIGVFGQHYSEEDFGNIKQCITAIGFGARLGNTRENAICKILKNGIHRSKFMKHWFIKDYYEEMNEIGKAVYKANKDRLKNLDCLYSVNKKNKKLFKKAKLMAYLYQHFERDAMDTAFVGFKKNIKLMVHDGCYAEGLSDQDIAVVKQRFKKKNLTVSVVS